MPNLQQYKFFLIKEKTFVYIALVFYINILLQLTPPAFLSPMEAMEGEGVAN